MNKPISIKKNAIANYIGQFYSMLVGIVVLPLYIQYLGPEPYGLVGFFTMLMSWIMLLDMGMTGTLARESARLKDKPEELTELKKLLRSIEALFFITSFFIIVIIYIFSNVIAAEWLTVRELPLITVEKSIKLMGLMVIMRWFVGLYQGAIIGFEQQVWLNVYKIFFNTLKYIGVFFLIKYIVNDIFYFFIYQLVVGILEFLTIQYKVYSLLPRTSYFFPSIEPLKKIAPFAISIAFTSGIWTVFTQVDKLLLSHYIPLAEYGYFTIVIVISAAIMQLSVPISQAILPRMTFLVSKDQEKEMLALYHKATQLVTLVSFSIVAIVSTFSYELLYAWTGNVTASKWAAPILSWYASGYGILTILAFQYYLQYAYGNLKYHVRYNIYFPFISLPFIYFSVINYGAIGAGIAWFTLNFISFIFWPAYVHHKFAKGIHSDWLWKGIFPYLIITIFCVILFKTINLELSSERIMILIELFFLGICVLLANLLFYSGPKNLNSKM